jgi:CBS domain-containing protein
VVDFLQEYPPFQAMEEDDLLALVERGRVRFHEIDERVYWQGKPAGDLFFVVQQGAVSLVEEEGEHARLRDVRGPGDLLGIERLLGTAAYRHSAKAASDTLLYGLPVDAMQPLLAKYPAAGRYLAAHASVSASYEPPDAGRRIDRAFAHHASRHRALLSCAPSDSARESVRRMSEAGADAIAVVAADGALRGIVTSAAVLRRLGEGSLAVEAPVEGLLGGSPATLAPAATVDQCLLAMADAPDGVVAITEGGGAGGRVHALVTPADLGPLFGEEPLGLLRGIDHASSFSALAELNHRARLFLLQELKTPAAVDWLSVLAHRFDTRILARILDLLTLPGRTPRDGVCWFLYGASGRAESMTPLAPQVGLVVSNDEPGGAAAADGWQRALQEALPECGYVAGSAAARAAPFASATLAEWQARFRRYVRDPIGSSIYLGRPLFDLRPLGGRHRLVDEIEATVRDEVLRSQSFVSLLGNDCLANMPPLAFFRDAVVEETGQESQLLHLWRSALLPLVDVGRVFAIEAGQVGGHSTIERFAFAEARHPAGVAIFREAADSMRVMLYHLARAGIRRRDAGAELDPASLSRYDRQVLRSGFASIHRLLELTAVTAWRSEA